MHVKVGNNSLAMVRFLFYFYAIWPSLYFVYVILGGDDDI